MPWAEDTGRPIEAIAADYITLKRKTEDGHELTEGELWHRIELFQEMRNRIGQEETEIYVAQARATYELLTPSK
jgi:hypothetical protein